MSEFNYQSEEDLLADGFVLLPEQAVGLKVYEKIVHHVDADAERVCFSVDADGAVASYSGPAPTVETVPAETPTPATQNAVASQSPDVTPPEDGSQS